MNSRQWLAFVFLSLVWGASFLWIRIAVREASPHTVVTLRLLFALIALLPFMAFTRPAPPRGARGWADVTVQGLMSAALPWLLIAWGEERIRSAPATVINATVPLFTLVCAHFALHDDRITWHRTAGMLVGFAGVAVLVSGDFAPAAGAAPGRLAGYAAMLVAAVLYGASNVYGRGRFRGRSPVYQAFYTLLVVGVLMWFVAPVADFAWPRKAITWVAIAWLGILSAGISYLVFYWLLHAIGPSRLATVTYTIPVVGVTLGVTVLHEPLSAALVIGSVLIVSGVAIVSGIRVPPAVGAAYTYLRLPRRRRPGRRR